MNEDTYIPQYITKYGLYSAQSILIVSILALILRYCNLSILLLCLYITTLLHWNNIKKHSVIKYLDMLLSLIIIIRITLYDSKRFKNRFIWNYSILVSLFVFVINEISLYFSLHYTKPNSIERIYAYYVSTYVHMIFLHILPTFTAAYCALI